MNPSPRHPLPKQFANCRISSVSSTERLVLCTKTSSIHTLGPLFSSAGWSRQGAGSTSLSASKLPCSHARHHLRRLVMGSGSRRLCFFPCECVACLTGKLQPGLEFGGSSYVDGLAQTPAASFQSNQERAAKTLEKACSTGDCYGLFQVELEEH